MIVTCPKCDHMWESRTRSPRLSCSRCNHTFMRPAPAVKVLAPHVTLHANCTNCGRPMADLNVCTLDEEPTFLCDGCLAELTK